MDALAQKEVRYGAKNVIPTILTEAGPVRCPSAGAMLLMSGCAIHLHSSLPGKARPGIQSGVRARKADSVLRIWVGWGCKGL